jgi:5'-phosphate synthase pdxT subunit
MATVVQRNGFGRQVDSFETDLDIAGVEGGAYHAVFIRAPRIIEIGSSVEILATLADGTIVAARERNIFVTAFHPELTTDDRLHRFFLDMSVEVTER